MTPAICVLMTVRDGMPFLPRAVQSILDQSYRDFEFLIIDDHSSDSTMSFLQQLRDPRVRILSSSVQGQTRSLNFGLHQTSATWIARMDSDDVSLPSRLAKQWAMAQDHPGALFISADYVVCDKVLAPIATMSLKVEDPEFLAYVRRKQNPFCHPVMMFRRDASLALGGYPEHLHRAQDYALWLALLKKGPFVHVPEPLLHYRVLKSAVSITEYDQQTRDRRNILGEGDAVSRDAMDLKTLTKVSRRGLYAYRLGFAAWIVGNRRECYRRMWRALIRHTRIPQTLAAIMLTILPRSLYLRLTGYDHVYR